MSLRKDAITLDDLIALNPEVNEECTNLWAGYEPQTCAFCVF
jgi:hypothetical protein